MEKQERFSSLARAPKKNTLCEHLFVFRKPTENEKTEKLKESMA
jgi:hypothetical protein